MDILDEEHSDSVSILDRIGSELKFQLGKAKWPVIMTVGRMAEAAGFNLRGGDLDVTHYRIQSSQWPNHYKPLRIAIAADFHVGCLSVNADYIKKNLVPMINAQNPDLILLPGDFLNSPHKYNGKYVEPEIVAEAFGELTAPLGAHAVLGNHDYWENGQGIFDALENVGISAYYNESALIKGDEQPFTLVGVADHGTGHENCEQAFRFAAKRDMPVITMAHNPQSFSQMPARNIALAVAGHTHGRQFTLPFFKHRVLDLDDQSLVYGLSHVKGFNAITTSGIGESVVPWRNVKREIVVVDLQTAPEISV